MALNRKESIKLGIKVLVTTALLILVFSQIDLGQFWQAVKTAKWQFLIAVWGINAISFWIQSVKMQLILKKQGCDVDIHTLFGVSCVTSLYGMVMPGMLSVAVKWYILKKDTGKSSNVLSSMVYNQLSAIVIMTAFGLGALIVTNPTATLMTDTTSRWLLPTVCGVLLVLIVLVSVLLLNGRTGGKIIRGFKLLLKPLPARLCQSGQEILDQVTVFQSVGLGFHLIIALITIIGTVVGGGVIYVLAAKGAHVTAPMGVFVWLWAVIYMLRRVPISIANLGVREATLVGLLSIYGVETSAALLMSMILFSGLVFIAGIGAIYQLRWSLGTGRKIKPSAKP